MGTSRSQAVACLDGAGPRCLGRFSSRFGTPVLMCLVSGAVATVTMAAAFAVSGSNGERYFSVVLSLSIVLLALSNLAVFPALVKLRRSHPDVVRPFRVPGGAAGAWLCATLATAWAAFAILAVLWPGLGTPNPDAALPDGFAGDRLGFVLAELVPLALVLAAALVFARLGRRSKRAPEVA
jgi:amino acid transporter